MQGLGARKTTPAARPRRNPFAAVEAPRRDDLRWLNRLAAPVSVLCLMQCFRARGNYVSCAFLPLLLPTLFCVASAPYRRHAVGVAKSLWRSLAVYGAGGSTPWRAVLLFAVIPAWLVYLSNDHIDVIGDTWPVVPTAISVVTEGNAELSEFLHTAPFGRLGDLPYCLRRRGHRVYSAYPSGMVPLSLPVVALSRLARAPLADPLAQLRLEKITAAGVAAASIGLFFLLALNLVRPAPALVTTAILAFASGMFTTVGQNLWQHDGVILGSLFVMLLEFRPRGRLTTILQGVTLGLLPACRITSLAFLLPFGLWILVRSPRRAAAMAAAALLAFSPWALYYRATYGSPFGPSSGQLAGSLWSSSVAMPLAGVLLSPARGLLIYQPWLVLVLLALLPSMSRRIPRHTEGTPYGWPLVCLAALVMQLIIVSCWWCWWGGWCWGSRLLIETVPLCALLCARPVSTLLKSRQGRCLLLALAILGILAQVPCVYLRGFRWNERHANAGDALWSWSQAPFLEPFQRPGL